MTSPRTPTFALAVAAGAAALVLAGCGDDPASTASDPAASDTSSPEPTDPAPTSPAPSESGDGGTPGDTVTVPVYFVGDGPRGSVLYREFRQVESDNPMAEAAALLAAGDTLDADYRSPFPAGASFGQITHDAQDGFSVALADGGLSERPQGMSKADARIAVQALLHTLQGTAQSRDALTAYLDGEPAPLLGIDTGDGVQAAPPLDVLSLVNVTTPEEGTTVSGSFTASGVGSSFEATIPWEIRQGDEVVASGFATAEGWMDDVYPWETEVDVSGLAPGDYTFAAMTDDPSGGTEGFGPSEDTKTITVE